MRILAVDDDPVILDLLKGCLPEDGGYDLVSYPCAESALDALNSTERPFDCILLDIMLPGINGIEMCEKLRKLKHHNNTPILMITGSKEVDLMARAFSAGATDFITKPLDNLELAARVKSAGLLNQSLATAHHSMSDLTQLVKVRFEEPLTLNVNGMADVIMLENELLRCKAGCFAMTMFTLEICGMRGIYRAVSAQAYRHCLEAIGAAALKTMNGHNVKLAYVGNGRFVCTLMERARLDQDALTAAFNADLTESWDIKSTSVPVPPTVRIAGVSTQRIWSGMSASEALRSCLSHSGDYNDLSLREENDLFSRLELKSTQSD